MRGAYSGKARARANGYYNGLAGAPTRVVEREPERPFYGVRPPEPARVPIKPSPTVIKRFRIWNEYWEGWAVYRRLANVWSVVEWSPEVKFLKGMNADKAKLELLRRGCKWEEIKGDK